MTTDASSVTADPMLAPMIAARPESMRVTVSVVKSNRENIERANVKANVRWLRGLPS